MARRVHDAASEDETLVQDPLRGLMAGQLRAAGRIDPDDLTGLVSHHELTVLGERFAGVLEGAVEPPARAAVSRLEAPGVGDAGDDHPAAGQHGDRVVPGPVDEPLIAAFPLGERGGPQRRTGPGVQSVRAAVARAEVDALA